MSAGDYELQKAKIKRARELVGEASDMDPGDAAIMFLLASIEAQHKALSDIAGKAIRGEPIEGAPIDTWFFKEVKKMMGPDFEKTIKGFTDSPIYKRNLLEATVKAMQENLLKCTIAYIGIAKLQDAGKDIL